MHCQKNGGVLAVIVTTRITLISATMENAFFVILRRYFDLDFRPNETISGVA